MNCSALDYVCHSAIVCVHWNVNRAAGAVFSKEYWMWVWVPLQKKVNKSWTSWNNKSEEVQSGPGGV